MKVPADRAGRKYKCVRCGAPLPESTHGPGPTATAAVTAPETQAFSDTLTREQQQARGPIGQQLIQAGLINQTQLEAALALQQQEGGKTFEILIRLGYLDKDALHAFLARQPGVASIDLRMVDIERQWLRLIPRNIALDSLVLPIGQLGKQLTVAMACPLDTATIDEIQRITGLKVKAMLCKLDDIHAAVARYYPEGDDFDSPATFELPQVMAPPPKEEVAPKVAAIEILGARDESADQLAALLVDTQTDPNAIAAVAGNDPPLAAMLLGVANSAAYGMPGQVDSLPMAVAALGREGVRHVMEQSLEHAVLEGKAMEALCLRAKRCANAAAALARETGRIGQQTAYAAALLFELGRFALLAVSPERCRRIADQEPGKNLAEAEHRLFSLAHPEAGALLARKWRLPENIAAAIEHYLDPENANEHQALASLVSIAALAAQDNNITSETIAPCKTALDRLGLDEKIVLDALAQTDPS